MERDKLISLVTKAQQGDQDALNDLFNAFYNDVYYFALKTVKDDQIACDVTQETFVEIINTLDKLQEPAAFVKWMKQITYHQCTRYFKKKKDVIVDEDEDGNTIFDTLAEENSEFIPDEALDKDEFKKTIMSMIDDLSEEQRAALMMFYYDELSIKQIAEIQGTNENTVKSRLNYAKKGIKKSVEDYEKKNGVKLHCVGVLPLLLWLFKDYFAQSVPASATVVAEGVAGATGTAVAITATTTTTVATTATTTAAVGIGAKIASLPIATKIIAGIVAATIAIGGVTTAVVLSNGDNNPSVDSSIVSGDDTSSTDDQQNDKSPDEYSFVPDYLKGLTHEQALQQYADWLCSYELPYFNSTDEIFVDDAFRFGYGNWQGHNENGVQIMTTSIGYQKDLLKAIFGRDFDFTQLTSKYVVEVPPAGTITNSTVIEIVSDVRLPSNASINMYPPVKDNGDGTYSYMFLHTKVVDTLPEGREEGTYDYRPDPENNDAMVYALHDHCVLLTIERKDDFWVMKSYEERPMSEWYAALEKPYQDNNTPQYGQQEMGEAQKQKLLRLQVQRILTPLKIVGLPYFSSPDELSTERVCWFILNCIENREQYETSMGVWEIPVTEFDILTEELFGKMYPYAELNSTPQGELYNVEYLAQQGGDMLRISVVGGAGGPEGPRATDYIQIDSDTYQVNFSWFVEDSDTPMNGYDQTMVFKFVNDHWQIVSFSKK